MQLIGGYDPEKENVYKAIDEYFDHPQMTFIEKKDGMDIYLCRLHSYLLNEHRFLIAMCSSSSPSSSFPKIPLKDLKWKNFQIRKLEDYEKYLSLRPHSYVPKISSSFARQKVEAVNSSRVYTEYDTGIPSLILHLLHVRNSFYEYSMTGDFARAIETFQAIFTWKEEEVLESDNTGITIFPTFSSSNSFSNSSSNSFSNSSSNKSSNVATTTALTSLEKRGT